MTLNVDGRVYSQGMWRLHEERRCKMTKAHGVLYEEAGGSELQQPGSRSLTLLPPINVNPRPRRVGLGETLSKEGR